MQRSSRLMREIKDKNRKKDEERNVFFTFESQLPDTGTVVGSARFVNGFAEELVVQLVRGLDLKLDGKILHKFSRKMNNKYFQTQSQIFSK